MKKNGQRVRRKKQKICQRLGHQPQRDNVGGLFCHRCGKNLGVPW